MQEILDQIPSDIRNVTRITTFGSSKTTADSIIGKAAALVGQLLGQRGFVNVNGAQGGTMEIVSRAVTEAGGDVIGVLRHPQSGCNPYVTHRVVCTRSLEELPYEVGMPRRTGVLIALGSGYVIFFDPEGGPGTGTETQAVVEYTLNLWEKKGFYRPVAIICEEQNMQNTKIAVSVYFGQKEFNKRLHRFWEWMNETGHDDWLRIYAVGGGVSFNADMVEAAANFVCARA